MPTQVNNTNINNEISDSLRSSVITETENPSPQNDNSDSVLRFSDNDKDLALSFKDSFSPIKINRLATKLFGEAARIKTMDGKQI